MSLPRLAVLNASHGHDATRRTFRRELDATLAEFDVTSGDLPAHVEFDGVVVTGSRASVYWDEDWIPRTRSWVQEAIEAGCPCLGICWGHQLLADALGGRVEDMGEYEIGYRTVEHTGDSRLFDGIDREFTAFTTHSDEVTELPPGATRLAENDYSIHGFRKGNCYGVQFHPDSDMETAREVTRNKDDQLSEERIESVLDGVHEDKYRAACEAKQVFDNFLAIVESLDEGNEPNAERANGD
jgi:GMP synthase (glutamine-hydrolysing)